MRGQHTTGARARRARVAASAEALLCLSVETLSLVGIKACPSLSSPQPVRATRRTGRARRAQDGRPKPPTRQRRRASVVRRPRQSRPQSENSNVRLPTAPLARRASAVSKGKLNLLCSRKILPCSTDKISAPERPLRPRPPCVRTVFGPPFKDTRMISSVLCLTTNVEHISSRKSEGGERRSVEESLFTGLRPPSSAFAFSGGFCYSLKR